MGLQKYNSGSINRDPIRLLIASGVLNLTDGIVEGDCTAGAITVTLLSASSCAGLRFLFKKVDSSVNAFILDAAGADLIDGAATYSLLNENDAVEIESDGATWNINASYAARVDPNIPASFGTMPSRSVVSADSPVQLLASDGVLIGSPAAAGNIVVDLPDLADVRGKSFWIYLVDGGGDDIVLAAEAGQTINGAASFTLVAGAPGDTIVLIYAPSLGVNWLILSETVL